MPNNISNYLENKLLDHSTGKASFTMPTVYLALYTSDPTDADSGTEVSTSGTAYARINLSTLNGGNSAFSSAASGAITTAIDITFATATASWGTVSHIGLRDASSAGNLLWHGALTASKTVGSGDVFKILAGDLDITLD